MTKVLFHALLTQVTLFMAVMQFIKAEMWFDYALCVIYLIWSGANLVLAIQTCVFHSLELVKKTEKV